MSLAAAEAMADAVLAGTYAPTLAEGCGVTFPLDDDPQVVRLTEFTLFAEPRRPAHGDGRYLIVQPHVLARTPRREIDRQLDLHVRPVAERVLRDLPTGDLPRPDVRNVDTIREALQGVVSDQRHDEPATRRVNVGDAPRLDLPEADLREAYGGWLEREEGRTVRRRLGAVAQRGLIPDDLLPNLNDLVKAIGELLVPGPYQPFASSYGHVALCATFEQEWRLAGYTRGELLSSLSLAPGEQLTLEVHSWDKSSRKSEEELATESEVRTTEKYTQRDALTVSQELAKQRNTNMNINAVIPVPKMPVTFGATASTQTQQTLKRTEDSLRESVIDAANALRVNRKTRIEVARETGREERQTRVIQNTNRCHTLNCFYFELIANYLVTTRLVSVDPCVLLQNPRAEFTEDWVLCHEDVLVSSLLSRHFLPGFDAARVIKTGEALEAVVERRAAAELERQGEDLAPQVTAIVTAWQAILAARDVVADAIDDCGSGFYSSGCIFADTSTADLERTAVYHSLDARVRAALTRLADEQRAGENAASALRRFVTVTGPADFAASVTTVQQNLRDFGLPGLVVDVITKDAPDTWDDAGLRGAIEATRTFLGAAGVVEVAQRDELPPQELAAAQVSFQQLRCHLEENWLHYLQAVWLREDQGQRFLRLQAQGIVTSVIENEVLGFYAGKAAYPLRTVDGLQDAVKLGDAIKDVPKLLAAAPPRPTLVSLPTSGTILEATTGQCDACEDFIQDSRVLDLRLQEANARQAEAEADRRRDRVLAGDLADPDPDAGHLVIEVRPPPGP